MQYLKRSQGFTIMELLVVIAIISILVGILAASFNEARIDSRNKAMKAEIRETQLALELYKAQNDIYPATLNALIPEYISEIPNKAKSANGSCSINYQVDGTSSSYYKLTATQCLEGAGDATEGIQPDDELARCPSTCGTCAGSSYSSYVNTVGFYSSIAVYSSGGECL